MTPEECRIAISVVILGPGKWPHYLEHQFSESE